MKLRYLPVAFVLLTASLGIAACDSANVGQSPDASRAVPASTQAVPASTPAVPASTPAVPASTPATSSDAEPAAPSGSPSAAVQAMSSAPLASPQPGAGFLKARAAWKQAASTSEAEMNIYLTQAADDLRASHCSSYNAAISELVYLINTPLTDVPPARQAKAEADVRALDSFFGTPGLMQ